MHDIFFRQEKNKTNRNDEAFEEAYQRRQLTGLLEIHEGTLKIISLYNLWEYDFQAISRSYDSLYIFDLFHCNISHVDPVYLTELN